MIDTYTYTLGQRLPGHRRAWPLPHLPWHQLLEQHLRWLGDVGEPHLRPEGAGLVHWLLGDVRAYTYSCDYVVREDTIHSRGGHESRRKSTSGGLTTCSPPVHSIRTLTGYIGSQGMARGAVLYSDPYVDAFGMGFMITLATQAPHLPLGHLHTTPYHPCTGPPIEALGQLAGGCDMHP